MIVLSIQFTQLLLSLLAVAILVPLSLLVRQTLQQRPLRKIPGPASISVISGNLTQFFVSNGIPFQQQMTDTYGRIFKLNGLFGAQWIFTSDPLALHNILVKQLDDFDSAPFFLDLQRLMLGLGLLAAPRKGGFHKRQRKLMNPAFSSAHLKRMIPIFHSAAKQMREIISADVARAGPGVTEMNVYDYLGRCALDIISQAGFGHDTGALAGTDRTIAPALKSIIPNGARLHVVRPLLPFLARTFPPRLLRAVGRCLPLPPLRALYDASDTLAEYSTSIWAEKLRSHARGEKADNELLSEGRDLLSILLQENSRASEEDRLPDAEVIGQINTFLFGGTDTTSNALSRILHQLALHPDVQEQMRAELLAAGAPDDIADDELDRLPLLDAVCRETLRVFAPIRFVQRAARKDAVLPLQTPMTDTSGNAVSSVLVPKGTMVFCNLAAANLDPAVWGADASEWKPARWLAPLPESVAEAHMPSVYGGMMTFAGGGRSCIGFKFSQLEMKTILAQLLSTLRFAPPEKEDIVWGFMGILTPATTESIKTNKAALPLRVSRI